jgi:hypothetical protein
MLSRTSSPSRVNGVFERVCTSGSPSPARANPGYRPRLLRLGRGAAETCNENDCRNGSDAHSTKFAQPVSSTITARPPEKPKAIRRGTWPQLLIVRSILRPAGSIT